MGQPLVVDDGTTVIALASVEVPQLQRRLGMAMIAAENRRTD